MVLTVAIACLVIAIVLAVYRVLRGPSWGDRITAFDFLTVNFAVLVTLLAVKTGHAAFLDAALIMSILAFLSTVALARYLLHGRVMQ